jgi:hypothetical protein
MRLRGLWVLMRVPESAERQAIRDVGGGKLIATVEDVDGNVIGLIQAP